MLRRIRFSLLASLLILSACANVSGENEKLQVVATSNIIADVVANVAGEQIEMVTLLPPGSDPHSFEPRPRDVVAVSEADIVFVNGLGLEEFLGTLLASADNEVLVVEVSQDIEPLESAGNLEHDDEREQSDGDEHEVDPHVWMSPNNVISWVMVIEKALIESDPANSDEYKSNAEGYIAELQELDAWAMKQVTDIPPADRKLVTDHDSLGYFAAYYGFDVVGLVLPSYSSQGEPSAGELAALSETIAEYELSAIFVDSTVNPFVADQIAAETGVTLVPIYTGSLSAADGPAATYIDMMHYNVEAIVNALK